MPDPLPIPEPAPIPIRVVHDYPSPPSLPPAEDRQKEKIDDFYPSWDAFLARSPKRASKASSLARRARKTQLQTQSSTFSSKPPDLGGPTKSSETSSSTNSPEAPSDGLSTQSPAFTSYDTAAAHCKATVRAIVDECRRLNQKFRDNSFDLEGSDDCLRSLDGEYPSCIAKVGHPPWIKRIPDIFDKPQFFLNGAKADDVIQGHAGDCWFLAALMSITAKKGLIESLCPARNEEVGVYGFVFYRDGEWIPEVVDDRLYLRVGDDDELIVVKDVESSDDGTCGRAVKVSIKHDMEKLRETLQKGGEALYFARCRSSETWLPLIEKAYAKAHGDYKSLEGGWVSEGIEDLTGGVAVTLNPEDIMSKDIFWADLMQVNRKYLFGGGSKSLESHGMVGGHAYTVLEAWEEGDLRLLKIRNPWGEQEWDGAWSDGSEKWTPQMMQKLNHRFGDDGVFWMAFEDFLKHFPKINRTRLFGPEWTVTQRWTSVNVPWTVDYLDTKFDITVDKAGPAVIVLCQPDARYFAGLTGRHCYSLHFRVYANSDREKCLVRSMLTSGGETHSTRSVSAELDLEPGTYSIVMKVTPCRHDSWYTADEQIKALCVSRKQKLLEVGRRFDMAHCKGKRKEKEQRNRREVLLEERESRRRENVKERHIRRLSRERGCKREKRIKDADAARKKTDELRKAEELIANIRMGGPPTGCSPPGSVEKRNAAEQEDSDGGLVVIDKDETGSSLPSKSAHQPCVGDNGDRELDDDDFEWDSDMDGTVELTDDEEELEDLHEKDPWRAVCVLGLRVYSMTPDTTVEIATDEEEDIPEPEVPYVK